MKRSEINAIVANAIEFFGKMNFKLPPFAFFSLEEWRRMKDIEEIVELKLGWDATSFGTDNFAEHGLLLFTLRNGALNSCYTKPYAEKIMIVQEKQRTPLHFHWQKKEDIINRGGGNLVIELFHADPAKNCLTGEDFTIAVDGRKHRMKSGEKLILTPGESVCLESRHAHTFYGEPGKGTVLVGEVSMVNDDSNDNCFIGNNPRFAAIVEDEPIKYLLAEDYRNLLG